MEKNIIKELTKLYSDIKIPYAPEYEYYLGLLVEYDDKLSSKISAYIQQVILNPDFNPSKEKFSYSDIIIDFIKENWLQQLNDYDYEINFPNHKNNSEFDENKIYTSMDIKSANWTVFKTICNLNKSWEEFAQTLGVPEYLIQSKQFRQIIFGNLNPKRQASIQKNIISNLYNEIKLDYPDVIFHQINTDEIICEAGIYKDFVMYADKKIELKNKFFTMKKIESRGDTFYIQTDFLTNKRKLVNCPGNRFFIHLKEQILNQPLDDKDLIFEVSPNQFAKWIV